MRNALIAVIALAVIFGAGWWYFSYSKTEVEEVIQEVETAPRTTHEQEDVRVIDAQGAAIGDENLAQFKCSDGKTITAVFERDIVGITLSDGRQLVLREAASGSGIRYLSNDTSIEFRGKGNEGSLIEGGTTTYADCVAS